MRSNGLILLIGILFVLLTDWALFLQIRQVIRSGKGRIGYILHTLIFIVALMLYYFVVPHLKGPGSYYWIGTGIGLLFLFYIPKLIFILISILFWPVNRFYPSIRPKGFRLATGAAIVCFLIILYSITFNRYNYKLETKRVCFPQLPVVFENFKIVQLSDLHLGSHTSHYRGIARLVDKVNRQEPDIIVFTGDMVNNFAEEITPWIPELSRLKARYGKYAVTGNHDYGSYTQWSDSTAKARNLTQFYNNMKAAGFVMLNNRSCPIIRENDTLYIAGVENWGNPPFPRYGKLEEALQHTGNGFVVLLSHDPSHWRAEALKHQVPLTLSGHTHAMQMGIKIGQREWSPAQAIYPEYDGLYRQGKQYLHVSRGQGYLGFPGRIGLRPQIDELILIRHCQD